MSKPVKVKGVQLTTHPVKNPTGLVLADKTPINVGMVIDGVLVVGGIWFRKHKDELQKADGKVTLTMDLVVRIGSELLNKDVALNVMAPVVPSLVINNDTSIVVKPENGNLKLVKEGNEDGKV